MFLKLRYMDHQWPVSHLCGSAAGPVRRPDGDVDAGRGLSVGGVSSFGRGQSRDDQAAGEAALPKQQAERGRGRGHLQFRERSAEVQRSVLSKVAPTHRHRKQST